MSIEGQKITVVGKVDPAKLRDKVEQKAHTKVEQISPQPKKDGGDKENSGGKVNDGGDNGKKEKKKDNDKKTNDKSDHKAKEKEVRFILPSFLLTVFPPTTAIGASGANCSFTFLSCACAYVLSAVIDCSVHNVCEFQCVFVVSGAH